MVADILLAFHNTYESVAFFPAILASQCGHFEQFRMMLPEYPIEASFVGSLSTKNDNKQKVAMNALKELITT